MVLELGVTGSVTASSNPLAWLVLNLVNVHVREEFVHVPSVISGREPLDVSMAEQETGVVSPFPSLMTPKE